MVINVKFKLNIFGLGIVFFSKVFIIVEIIYVK